MTSKLDVVPVKYEPSLCTKPAALFSGFSWIDTWMKQPIGIRLDVSKEQQDGFEGTFSTWQDVSQYYQLKASYVAIL
jgi:hypothetical protein